MYCDSITLFHYQDSVQWPFWECTLTLLDGAAFVGAGKAVAHAGHERGSEKVCGREDARGMDLVAMM